MKKTGEDELFTRGVAQFTDPDGAFAKALEEKASGKRKTPVIVKFGVDPTRPDIHLGHAVVLQKLRALQDRGAKVIFLIGDFTAMIGDPTGKSKVRPDVAQQEVEANMKTYLDQVGKILDLSPEKFSWMRNSDWFYSPTDVVPGPNTKVEVAVNDPNGKQAKVPLDPNSFVGKAVLFEQTRMQATHLKNPMTHGVSLVNFLAILRRLTFARLIGRDLFQERITSGNELYLHELMYPVFQAIDSHLIARVYGSCDLEIGGSDQTFNMLMGRDVMKLTGQPQQSVMAMELIEGIDGKEKMSKSLDNYIGITDMPSDMYGKVMSIPDALIPRYMELATYAPDDAVENARKLLKAGKENPRDLKMALARQIVAIYHGEKKAAEAEEAFVNTFRKGELPKEMASVKGAKGDLLADVLVPSVVASKTIFKRYVAEGAISAIGDGEEQKITDHTFRIEKGMKLRIGKKTFVEIVVVQ